MSSSCEYQDSIRHVRQEDKVEREDLVIDPEELTEQQMEKQENNSNS